MKRLRGKETNSICRAVSACSSYSGFEAASGELMCPESRTRGGRNRGLCTERGTRAEGEQKALLKER